MSESLVAGLRGRYQELEGRLGAARDAAAREAVKREIIALFKQVDGALTELAQLKDGIRGLAERYKRMNNTVDGAAAGAAPAPQFTGERPTVQADHLGASTFIEKGGASSPWATTPARYRHWRRRSSSPRGKSRPSHCSGGPRCSTRTTTRRSPPSPRC